MVLEETELLKLQYMNDVQTAASHISNIQDSDKELAEKVTQFLNISKKIRISKANYHSRKGAITVAESNKSSGKPLPSSYSNNNSQSPCSNNFCGRSTERRNLQNCSENRHSRSISQNSQSRRNYYGSNSDSSSYSTYNIAHFQIPQPPTAHFHFLQTILTKDRIIFVIIIDPLIFLEKETKTIKTDQESVLSHHIETLHSIKTNKIQTTEEEHRTSKDKLIKYNLQINYFRPSRYQQHKNYKNFRATVKPHTL